LCPVCGYDLRGNTSGVCPECGTRIDQRTANKAPAGLSLLSETQPWWVWTLVVAVMISAAIVQRYLT
jgi:predicted amidophosphoribosyltransferase